MPKMTLEIEGKILDLEIRKVSRETLYGAEKKVARVGDLDCSRAGLTEDGFLVMPGCTTDVYLDKDGNPLTRGELRTADGRKKRPPTLDGAYHLEAAQLEELLDYDVHAVYCVTGAPPIGDRVYRTEFSYSWAYDYRPAFLLENPHGQFLLVVEPSEFQWAEPRSELLPDLDDSDDDFDIEDLDWEAR